MKIPSYKIMAIALNETESSVVDCRTEQLVALMTDADWTAQNLTLQASMDNSENSYCELKNADGTQWKVTSAAASSYIPMAYDLTQGLRFIKVVSGAAQAKATNVFAVLRDLM